MNKFDLIHDRLLPPKGFCPGCGTNCIHEINCPTLAAIITLKELEEERDEQKKTLDRILHPLYIMS